MTAPSGDPDPSLPARLRAAQTDQRFALEEIDRVLGQAPGEAARIAAGKRVADQIIEDAIDAWIRDGRTPWDVDDEAEGLSRWEVTILCVRCGAETMCSADHGRTEAWPTSPNF